MIDYFLLFATIILINNFILINFFKLHPFIEIYKKLKTIITIGLITIFIIILTIICSWFIDKFTLIHLNLIHLHILSFILVISILIQFIKILIYKTNLILCRFLNIFLPLIILNCAILYLILFNINQSYNFLQSIFYSFIFGMGFFLITILFFFIREHIFMANIPTALSGLFIELITIWLMSLAFMGFSYC
ncbi:MAG: Rnf-Nqr domain containing protein [Arsenophonus sp. ET-YP4-MAG3]